MRVLTMAEVESNNHLAADQVIVENFFGRMKQLWGLSEKSIVMHWMCTITDSSFVLRSQIFIFHCIHCVERTEILSETTCCVLWTNITARLLNERSSNRPTLRASMLVSMFSLATLRTPQLAIRIGSSCASRHHFFNNMIVYEQQRNWLTT